MASEAAERAAEEWSTNSCGAVPDDRLLAPMSYLTLWKRDKQMLKEGFLAGAEWGRQTPQWINVEDKLPERRKGVLLYHDVWGVTRGYLNETSPEIAWRDERGDAIQTSSVLYWMPLPAAPEGHSNES